MRRKGDNPFERFDLDPGEGPAAITERLRELAEDADDAGRAAIRDAWEALTLHPRGRVQAALGAHPESRPPLPRARRRAASAAAADPIPDELVAPPRVADAVPTADPLPDLPLTDDPFLSGDPHAR